MATGEVFTGGAQVPGFSLAGKLFELVKPVE